jgi:predicted CXXCH cytochrome family protein
MKTYRFVVLLLLSVLFLSLLTAGCARTWQFTPIESYKTSETVPPASACAACHQSEYESWKKTRHSSEVHMTLIPVPELRECGACHDNIAAHAADVAVKPGTTPSKLSKTEQNRICGKCHYNQDIFGSGAINPDDKHALFMSVGFEGKKKQIACLDCHSGHKGKSEMLISMKANICFTCHKAAIVTMGIFQPLNYLTFGKTCQACHAVHGGSSGAQAARMGAGVCVICHFVGVALVD